MNPFVPPQGRWRPPLSLGSQHRACLLRSVPRAPSACPTVPGPSWQKERGGGRVVAEMDQFARQLFDGKLQSRAGGLSLGAAPGQAPSSRSQSQHPLPSVRPGLPWFPARLPLRTLGFLLTCPAAGLGCGAPGRLSLLCYKGPCTVRPPQRPPPSADPWGAAQTSAQGPTEGTCATGRVLRSAAQAHVVIAVTHAHLWPLL